MARWANGAIIVGTVGAMAFVGRCYLPEFRERYGERRGPAMLLLFLVSLPAWFVADLFDGRRQRRTDGDSGSSDRDDAGRP